MRAASRATRSGKSFTWPGVGAASPDALAIHTAKAVGADFVRRAQEGGPAQVGGDEAGTRENRCAGQRGTAQEPEQGGPPEGIIPARKHHGKVRKARSVPGRRVGDE